MDGISISHILQYGLAFSLGFGLIILGTLSLNPRLMLASYPKQFQAQQPPLTSSEKKQQIGLGILLWGYVLVGLFYSNVQLVLKPPFLFIPGALALVQEQGFGFHFRGFLKGSAFGIIISAVVALIATLVLRMVA